MTPGGQEWTGSRSKDTPAPAVDVELGELEAMGNAAIRTMHSLRDILGTRAQALEAERQELETARQQLLAQQRELAAREQRWAEQSHELERRARGLEALEQELGKGRQELQERWAAAEADRTALEQRSAAIEDSARALHAGHEELAAARESLAAREAELMYADQVVRSRDADLDAEWRSRLREVEQARERVAMLQSRLEAELARVTHRHVGLAPEHESAADELASGGQVPTGPTIPASVADREALERLQKLSRDARRRATGG